MNKDQLVRILQVESDLLETLIEDITFEDVPRESIVERLKAMSFSLESTLQEFIENGQ